MGQMKPDTPTIIKRIIQEASLPKKKEEGLHKLNRQQLLELYMYITELKKSNQELNTRLDEILAEEKNVKDN